MSNAVNKSSNDFKKNTKVAVITNVNPQKKTVDIKYTSQAGEKKNITLGYSVVGLTWGLLYMPMKGDKVYIDNSDGDNPVIKGMYPTNTDFLPYLDSGEMAVLCENGSYLLAKNRRKRIKSTGQLIDYDATKGPNGETDIELEPGGLVLRARNKQSQDGVYPTWDSHGYIALHDNGDIAIQSMYKDNPKGLLFMDGTSGYVFLSAGNGSLQEYIEFNPLLKHVTHFTDGDELHHIQKNLKTNVYGGTFTNSGSAIQTNIGVDISGVPIDFDKITLDSDLKPGDYRLRAGNSYSLHIGTQPDSKGSSSSDNLGQGDIFIDNSGTNGTGIMTVHLKGSFNLICDQGDVNVNTSQGNLTMTIAASAYISALNTVTIDSSKSVFINGSEGIYLNGSTATGKLVTSEDFDNHTHSNVENGLGVSGAPLVPTQDRQAYLP